MASEQMLIKNWWAFVRVGHIWFRNGCVGGSRNVWTISTVHADASFAFAFAFAFASDPLQRCQDRAGKEPDDEVGEVNMEGFIFLFH
jgi:hypothetical protein